MKSLHPVLCYVLSVSRDGVLTASGAVQKAANKTLTAACGALNNKDIKPFILSWSPAWPCLPRCVPSNLFCPAACNTGRPLDTTVKTMSWRWSWQLDR